MTIVLSHWGLFMVPRSCLRNDCNTSPIKKLQPLPPNGIRNILPIFVGTDWVIYGHRGEVEVSTVGFHRDL